MSDTKLFEWGSKVRIKVGWHDSSRAGVALGPAITLPGGSQKWVPVLWDDEEDPDFFKEAGLDIVGCRWI